MKIFASMLLSLAIALPAAAQADPVALTVGDATIQFPSEPGYVRVSQAEPRIFSVAQAALPPSNRLVELFESSADLARARAGGALQETYFQVQVARELESRQISVSDWNDLKPQLTAGMASADLDQAIASEASDSNARMSAATGKSVAIHYGKVGQPTIYRQTPMSVSFSMQVPIQITIGGSVQSATMAAACAMVVVRNKLIYIYAFSAATSDASMASLRASLDRTVDQTTALNPSDSSVASTGGMDWKSVGRSAFIGALVAGGIGFFRLLTRKK